MQINFLTTWYTGLFLMNTWTDIKSMSVGFKTSQNSPKRIILGFDESTFDKHKTLYN